MSTDNEFGTKEKELIAVGASIAAGCRSCTEHHVNAARDAGAETVDIRRAVDLSLNVRETAAEIMAALADKLLDAESVGATPVETGVSLIDELVCVGSAVAVNCVAGVERHVAAAKELGADNRHLRTALGIARMVKKAAGDKADKAASSSEQPQPCSDTPTCGETANGQDLSAAEACSPKCG